MDLNDTSLHPTSNTPPEGKPPAGREGISPRDRLGQSNTQDLSFLVEATRLLADSLEVESTLATVARLSLPHFGSWCIVDLHEGDHMRRLSIIHPEPKQQSLANELLVGWPPLQNDVLGIPSVMQTRSSEVISPVTDEMLVEMARSPKNLVLLRALQIGSLMTVPLLTRGEVLGAITYVSPSHGDSFSHSDLVLAEDLAARCAIAIDNSRLFQHAQRARAEAEEANRIKMRFLSNMSHELRTPLNAIAGYAELLETGIRGALTEMQRADVRRIQANQRHLLGLVESVLSYAKVEAGRIEFHLEDVSLAHVLAAVDQIITPLADAKKITCLAYKPLEQRDVMVYADMEKLRQILVNLLANAIKFSPEEGKIEVTHQYVGTHIEIRVSDTGIGIAATHQERIFEPFLQVDEQLTNAHGGTGLGLAISRALAIGMSGNLFVESELGRGSTFTLSLPQGRG